MQIISQWSNLHELLKPIFWKNKRTDFISLSSAEFAQRVVNFKLLALSYIILTPPKSDLLYKRKDYIALKIGAIFTLWEQILFFKSSPYFRSDTREIFFFFQKIYECAW